MSKRTEITIEQHEVTVIRSGQHSAVGKSPLRGWCPFCEREVDLFVAEEAAQLAKVGRREIYRRIESGELHVNETPNGEVQVCSTSLRALYS